MARASRWRAQAKASTSVQLPRGRFRALAGTDAQRRRQPHQDGYAAFWVLASGAVSIASDTLSISGTSLECEISASARALDRGQSIGSAVKATMRRAMASRGPRAGLPKLHFASSRLLATVTVSAATIGAPTAIAAMQSIKMNTVTTSSRTFCWGRLRSPCPPAGHQFSQAIAGSQEVPINTRQELTRSRAKGDQYHHEVQKDGQLGRTR